MACCCSCTIAIGAILAFILYKLFCCKKCKKRELFEKNFKEDVVYLYQFPRAKTVPNISPYCLKIESFLRLNKIKYENRFTFTKRSVHGLLPFIELNGEQIADSEIIEEQLKKHFKIPVSSDEAISQALARLVSHHTTPISIKYKMIDEAADTVDQFFELLGIPAFLEFLKPLAIWFFKRTGRSKVKKLLGLFSDSEFDLLLRKDLDSLKGILADNKFFLGDKISNVDASIFGHIAPWYYGGGEKKGYVARTLDESYPSLVAWCQRVRAELFPDDFTQN